MTRKTLGVTGTAMLCALMAPGAGADELDFDTLYAFGDSLTDTGNLFALTGGGFPPVPPYFDGRFSNGPVWIESFAPRLGLGIDFTQPFAGNLAIGGAYTGIGGNAGVGTGVFGQIDLFLSSAPGGSGESDDDDDDEDDEGNRHRSGGRESYGDDDDGGGALGEDDLIVLWAGANDYLRDVIPAETDPSVPVGNIGTAVQRLSDAGGESFLVFNLPDLGAIPLADTLAASTPGADLFLTALTNAHNSLLAAEMADLRGDDIDITLVDVNAAFAAILANPARFGFNNVEQSCLFSGPLCTDPDTWLFWDDLHPTAAGHAVVSDVAVATLRGNRHGPRWVGAQRELAALMGAAQGDVATSRMRRSRHEGRRADLLGNRFAQDGDRAAMIGLGADTLGLIDGGQAPVDGETPLSFFLYGADDTGVRESASARIGFDYDNALTAFGVDYRLSEAIVLGVAFGSGEASGDLDGDSGSLALASDAVTLYGSFRRDRFYTDTSVGFSDDRYEDIGRITGSTLFPVATAATEGNTLFTAVESGYLVAGDTATFGPFAGLSYRRSTIDGYRESGAGPLNLDVERQADESLIGRLGLRASLGTDSPLGRVSSRLSLSIEREFRPDDAIVATSLPGNAQSRLTADGSDIEAIRVDGALDIRFTEALSAGIDYAGRVGTESGTDYEVLARFTIGF